MNANQKRKFSILHYLLTLPKRQLSIFLLLAAMLVGFSTKVSGKPEKMITVQVHVIECDAPAPGASVNIEDAGWDDNLASGITNSSGDCTLKAPVNENIIVVAKYKGKQQKTNYFVTDSVYALQIVYLKFDDNCDDDQIPEKATIKYSYSNGDKVILTFDNHYQRYRYEFWGTSGTDVFYHAIHIYNPFIHKYYEKACDDCEWSESDDSAGDLEYMHENDLSGSNEDLLKQGYKRIPDKIIGGKSCTGFRDDNGHAFYKWKRIKMSEVSGKEVGFEVTEITLDASESAFIK